MKERNGSLDLLKCLCMLIDYIWKDEQEDHHVCL